MTEQAHTVVDRLETLMRRLTARRPIAQAIVAVERGDGTFRWVGTSGETASGEPVSGGTPFFIASIDKLYNATIALALAETGRLDLDSPIAAYLPDAVVRGLHRHQGTDHSERITVRHLLSHTSGLADWLEDYPKSGTSLVGEILGQGDRLLAIEEIAGHVRERLTPHFPPQDLSGKRPRARYSDTNFMLVIAIIEAVTGRPLHEVHEQMLYRPLGLHHTCFPGLSQPIEPTPEPMILRAAGQPLSIPLLMKSIRGIYSTAADTMAFLRRLMRHDVFRSPETLASMTGRWHAFGFPLDRAALRAPGWPVEYGMGIMRFRLPRIFSPAAPMPAVVGHTGSTGCWLFYCPDRDILLSGSVDEVTAGALPYRIVPKILRALGDWDGAPRT